MMNTKQRGGGCCSVMSVMTVVMNKRVTGVLCGAENSLRHKEREASKHEIREEVVMQLSAPTALGGEVCVWGGVLAMWQGRKHRSRASPISPRRPLIRSHNPAITPHSWWTLCLLCHLHPRRFYSCSSHVLHCCCFYILVFSVWCSGSLQHCYTKSDKKFLLMDLQINICISYFCGIYSNNIVNKHSAKQCLFFAVCRFDTSIIRQMLVQ